MLSNYMLSGYKVLFRRKLFTFISLFAVSLTLAILLVLLTIIDNFLHPTGPEKHYKHFITVDFVKILHQSRVRSKSGNIGFRFYQDNITRLKIPQKTSLYSKAKLVTHYVNNNKINSLLRYTDVNYWQILDFTLLTGRRFNQQDFAAAANYMIISESTAKTFFGQTNPLNQTLDINLQSFTIIGVVKDVSNLELEARGNMWALSSVLPQKEYENELIGQWNVMLYHADANQLEAISDEYQQLLSTDPILIDNKNYTIPKSYTNTHLDKLVRYIMDNDKTDSGADTFIFYLILLIIGFMLLPAINLINLNIGRIIERAEEIAIRRSFGASSHQLMLQFFIENLVLTTLGAIIGLLLSFIVLFAIEANPFTPFIDLTIGLNGFCYLLILVLVFSLLSGIYPAWKMSKLHPIQAFKGKL